MLSIGFTALEEADKLFFVVIVIFKAKFIVSPPLFSLFMSSVSFTFFEPLYCFGRYSCDVYIY